MCGRFTLKQPSAAIAQAFGLQEVPELAPQYNIAPTLQVATVLQNPESKKRSFQQMRWGLIPSWAKDPSMGAKLINARSESVAEKPSFRSAFKRRRCLVLADGFYEWQKLDGKKQPFYFHLQSEQPFGFAGLWEKWESKQGEEITSCTILTTTANELMQQIHDRMPVILDPKDYDLWLNQDGEWGMGNGEWGKDLEQLLRPYPAQAMTAYPVSTLVNNPRNNSPECIQPTPHSPLPIPH